VGVNIFTSDPESETPLGVQRVSDVSTRKQIEDCTTLKKTRDHQRVSDAIERLGDDAKEGRNIIPAMIEATKAFATTAEMMGTVREAFGYSYDPMNIVESPFGVPPDTKVHAGSRR
jgi:methylmalonyl-CoA mutase N-terminal domain/subunit